MTTIINFLNSIDPFTFFVLASVLLVIMAIIAYMANKHFDQVVAIRDARIAAICAEECVQRESMTDIKMDLYARMTVMLPMYATSIAAYTDMIMVMQKLANSDRNRCVSVLMTVQAKYPMLAYEVSAIIDRVELARLG